MNGTPPAFVAALALATLVSGAAPLACRTAGPLPKQDESGSLLRGDRREGAQLRSSANRPRPGLEEHGPFETDRLALTEAIARHQERHREQHNRRALVLESFSHPACAALSPEERRGCPLVALRWTSARTISRGVELLTEQTGLTGPLLRLRVLCHIAFGKAHPDDDDCPFHAAGVRALVLPAPRSGLLLRLETDDADGLRLLRARVKRLVPLE